jgi:hypothetical protein
VPKYDENNLQLLGSEKDQPLLQSPKGLPKYDLKKTTSSSLVRLKVGPVPLMLQSRKACQNMI